MEDGHAGGNILQISEYSTLLWLIKLQIQEIDCFWTFFACIFSMCRIYFSHPNIWKYMTYSKITQSFFIIYIYFLCCRYSEPWRTCWRSQISQWHSTFIACFPKTSGKHSLHLWETQPGQRSQSLTWVPYLVWGTPYGHHRDTPPPAHLQLQLQLMYDIHRTKPGLPVLLLFRLTGVK